MVVGRGTRVVMKRLWWELVVFDERRCNGGGLVIERGEVVGAQFQAERMRECSVLELYEFSLYLLYSLHSMLGLVEGETREE